MINTTLGILQADIMIVSGFISALPDHKTAIDGFIKENYGGTQLVCKYLLWTLKTFAYSFKISNFYNGALEDDVLPVRLAHFLTECYLQYFECTYIEELLDKMS